MQRLTPSLVILTVATLAGCSSMQMGSKEAKTTATGSAGGANAEGANSQLERCAESLGTLTVVEDSGSNWYRTLRDSKLGSTTPVLKLLVQQSNCFVVVERGRALDNAQQERALQQSGELREGSNFGKGQMVSADYTMSPSVTFSNNDAGRVGGAVGGLLPGSLGAAVGFVAGNAKFKEASTVLTLVDNRSTVQLAAAEGSARNVDFGAFGGAFMSGLAGVGGGYANTAEGKVIVAAFTDAYNNLVKAVRNYKAQEVKGGLGKGGQLKIGQ